MAATHHQPPGPGSTVPANDTATGIITSELKTSDSPWYSRAPVVRRASLEYTKYSVHVASAPTPSRSPRRLHVGESVEPNTTSPTPASATTDSTTPIRVTVSPNRREKNTSTAATHDRCRASTGPVMADALATTLPTPMSTTETDVATTPEVVECVVSGRDTAANVTVVAPTNPTTSTVTRGDQGPGRL